MTKFYDVGNRDIVGQDKAGGYYFRHVQALTAEALHSKSDIAAELAHRDIEIDRLQVLVDKLIRARELSAVASTTMLNESLAHQENLRACRQSHGELVLRLAGFRDVLDRPETMPRDEADEVRRAALEGWATGVPTPPCEGYRRSEGVMGGPCLNCGRSQPEHAAAGPDAKQESHDG